MHQLSVERAITRKTAKPVNALLSEAEAANVSRRQKEKEENRHIVAVIFDVARHLALQNEAFRGHDETAASFNQGKFLEEIKFLAKYHALLRSWLEGHPGNVSWLGARIQNEMIDIIATKTLETIIGQVKEARFYSVECDEVTSHKHSYMSIVLRYVYQNTIYERVVGLKHVMSLKGKSLSDVLVEELGKVHVPLNDMVGKAFDGASNMSGKDHGMQQELTKAGATSSIYFHCFAHRLNLVLGKCAETLPLVKDVFETIGSIYRVMEGSPQRNAVYEAKLEMFGIKEGRTALRSLSDTRWTARTDNLSATLNVLPALAATLKELEASDNTCAGLLISISSFEFLLKVVILQECFQISRVASEYLQREDMDMVTAVDAVQTLVRQLKSFRSDARFAGFLKDAQDIASKCGIKDDFSVESAKRRRTLPSHLGDGQVLLEAAFSLRVASSNTGDASESPATEFRRSFYYSFLDLILSELEKRFSSKACEVMVQLSALHPNKWDSGESGKIEKLAKRYGVPEQAACREYCLFKNSSFLQILIAEMEERKKNGVRSPYLPFLLKQFRESDLETLYPNLHKIIQIAATLPVTTASCERCHSKVKIISSYLRATMSEERLDNLVLISSERDISSDIELPVLVDQFAIKPRKVIL